MIISFRQLPPTNQHVNVYVFKGALKSIKAVNLNGRMFWFYWFAPLDVYEFHDLDKYKWSF